MSSLAEIVMRNHYLCGAYAWLRGCLWELIRSMNFCI